MADEVLVVNIKETPPVNIPVKVDGKAEVEGMVEVTKVPNTMHPTPLNLKGGDLLEVKFVAHSPQGKLRVSSIRNGWIRLEKEGVGRWDDLGWFNAGQIVFYKNLTNPA